MPEKPIFDLVRPIVPLILIGSSSNMWITRKGLKYRQSSNMGQIGIFALELFAIDGALLAETT